MRLTLSLAIAGLLLVPVASHAQQDDSILSDTYVVSQEFVEAEVLRVNTRNRTITVRGEKRGQTRTFTIAEGARVSIEGREARLRDLRRGDKVALRMTPQAERVVITRVRVPDTPTDLPTRRANPPAVDTLPAALPKTASQWPFVLLTGGLALFVAGFLRIQRRR